MIIMWYTTGSSHARNAEIRLDEASHIRLVIPNRLSQLTPTPEQIDIVVHQKLVCAF